MPESQNIEYKANWRDEYLKWICGFANSNGGILYIGIDDQGDITGIENHHLLLEQLPNKLRDLLGVFAEVNLKTLGEKHYVEIIVPRYDVPISLRGKYYMRSGSTLQELSGIVLNEFILKRTGKTWDDVIEPRASINDIDKKTVKKFIQDTRKLKRIQIESSISTAKLLEKLRLYDNGQLKRGAIIVFGKDPGRFYPNTDVKIGRFGVSDADIKHHELAEGNLIQLVTRIGETLNSKFFIHPIDFEGMQRIERDEYPVAAVREMILNALVHRNYNGAPTQIRLYDQSFTVWNDGGLPDGITEADLRVLHRSKPRNPLIADVCFKAGYIDTWGRGTIKIIEACREMNLPEPSLYEEQGGFFCGIYKPDTSNKQEWLQDDNAINTIFLKAFGKSRDDLQKLTRLNERQLRGLLYLAENSTITNSEYKELFDITDRTALRDLNGLVQNQIIKKAGVKKGTYYTPNNVG